MKTRIYITIIAGLISLNVFSQANLAGNTLNHDGTTNVNVGNADFGLTDKMTIMFWVKWSIDPATGNKWANMVTINSTSQSDRGQFWLQHNSNNSKFEFALATLGSNNQFSRNMIFSNTTPIAETWYHIAAVYDGSRMMLYVNGVLENTQNKTGIVYPLQSDYILTMASWAQSNNNYRAINGQLDEVSIWNQALSEERINEIMNNLLMGTEDGLVAYYRFDENTGNVVNDLTGNGFDGTNTSLNGGQIAGYTNSTAPIFGILPVDLLYFNAEEKENNIELTWATASEKNNDYFTIYRSIDGENWEEVSRIEGAGNSNIVKNYNFIDNNPVNGTSYYKLRQTDFDGRYEEFEIVSVNIMLTQTQVTLYPNPASEYINVNYFVASSSSEITVNIFNASGKLLISSTHENNEFGNEAQINLQDLDNGMYYMQVSAKSELVYKSSFIVNK
ncbi:MAG: T9SS type A sorting domain-containing protein [Bacteroidales bacterium]|nr:T9SS type A sorting domain-containing protein [Bacteroidales bacterium]